jgi:hypothetical protein
MLAAPFLTLPSKRKLPQYYQRVTDPIDLCTLEQNIVTGFYRTVESFDQDMGRLFNNNVRFFGRTSELGIAATRLRKAYNLAKADFLAQIEEILGESPPASFLPEHDPGLCFVFRDLNWSNTSVLCVVIVHDLHVVPEANAFMVRFFYSSLHFVIRTTEWISPMFHILGL